MKFLTDRKEIARVINIEDTPMITFDLDNPMPGYDGCYAGSKVKVLDAKRTDRAYAARCTAHIWSDAPGYDPLMPFMCKKIDLNCYGTCICADFGYSDILTMETWSNARTVKAGDRVVVFFKSDTQKVGFLRLMKVSDRVDVHCATVATLTDIED